MSQGTGSSEPLKALVVDSDPASSASLGDALKNCGYTVINADEVNAAMALLDVDHFEVVLCQETVNGGSSLDILKLLQKRHPDTPFIIMTDNAQSPGVAEAMQLGAAEVFATPGDYTDLYPKLAAFQAKAAAKSKASSKMTVHPVQLPEIQATGQQHERANVEMILDVPVTVNAVLGSTTLLISDLLQLGPGGVVELNKRAGEPVDLYVNDKLIAMGEVVVVNETFGVRITEVIDPKQRVQALG